MRYKVTVSYEGSLFLGWQIQLASPTVQEEIERVLSQIENKKVQTIVAGRTDRGVSALGQVFHFDSEHNIPLDKYPEVMNNHLVDGIHIEKMHRVADDFHARKDAKWKHYRYSIEMGRYTLFERNHVLQLNRRLNVSEMIKAAQVLIGTHDFTSFNTKPLSVTPNQIRTIYTINLSQENQTLHIDYYGNGFLRYMIRMMTQTLIEVGLNKLTPREVQDLLAAKNKEAVIYNAPPQGLTLIHVEYERDL